MISPAYFLKINRFFDVLNEMKFKKNLYAMFFLSQDISIHISKIQKFDIGPLKLMKKRLDRVARMSEEQ